jgi:hypothetical protein
VGSHVVLERRTVIASLIEVRRLLNLPTAVSH